MSAQTDEERRAKEWRGKGQKERVTQRDGEKIEQEIKKKKGKWVGDSDVGFSDPHGNV